jgi:hypothetical protein
VSHSTFELKLARARDHLTAFASEVEAFQEQPPYRIATVREGNDIVLRVHDLVPVPSRLALIAGDVVHNARSALDHLMVSLAQEGEGTLRRRPTDEEERRIDFPVTDNQAAYRKKEAVLRKFLSDEVLKRTRLLQPHTLALLPQYSGLDQGQIRALMSTSLLRRLSLLDNIDKHRRLTLALWFPGLVDEDYHNSFAESEGNDPSARVGLDESMEGMEGQQVLEEELARLTELWDEEPEGPDAYDFYFSGGPLIERGEIGRYIRNDRGPMPELGRLEVKLRVVLYEPGLTRELPGAPPATATLKEMVDEAQYTCVYVQTGEPPVDVGMES